MPAFSTRQRFMIALGGFVSFLGFIILVVVSFAMAGLIDLENILQAEFILMILLIVGILDILCGLVLLLKDRKKFFSFTADQKKPDDDVN